MKWQDVNKLLVGSASLILVLVGILNLSGMSYSIPPNITCEDCYSQVQVNSTYWEICVEHSGNQSILYKKVSTSRRLWVNLDKIEEFIPTYPTINVELLVPTTKTYATVKHDEFGYLRPVKDGDCIIKRKTLSNPSGSRFVIHGSKEPWQTVKYGFELESLLIQDIKFDPIWMASAIPVSPSTETSLDGKELTIHKADKYFDGTNWITGNITDVLKLERTGKYINMSYLDKYITYEIGCIKDGIEYDITTCMNFLNIYCPNVSFNFHKFNNEWYWKYALNISNLETCLEINSTNTQILLKKTDTNLMEKDIKLIKKRIIVGNLELGFEDLLNSNFTIKFNKSHVVIGNLYSGWIDPTLTISGTTVTMCGFNNTYTKIEVINGGTLAICDYDGTSGKGMLNISLGMVEGNFTVDLTSWVNGIGKGYRGGVGATGDGSGGTGEGLGGGQGGCECNGGAGSGFGGAGGNGGAGTAYGSCCGVAATGGSVYDSIGNGTLTMGSGGGGGGRSGTCTTGNGGDGGALFFVSAKYINIFGNVTVNGEKGYASGGGGAGYRCGAGGGGSGGGILLWGRFINYTNGILNASGGSAGDELDADNSYSGGPGGAGGGRIKIFYITTFQNTSSTESVYYGTGDNNGVVGTKYYNNTIVKLSYFNNISIPSSPTAYSQNKPYLFEIWWSYTNSTFSQVWIDTNHTGSNVSYYLCGSYPCVSNDTFIPNLYKFNLTDRQAMTFRYRWYANTTLDNLVYDNNTDLIHYIILKTPTSINLLINSSNINNQNFVVNDTLNFTAILNITGNVCFSLNKTGYGNNFQCGTSPQINISRLTNWVPAIYNITANYTGNVNKSSVVTTLFFGVYNFSVNCSKAFPSFIILPENATEFNITPYGQSTLTPYWNCTNKGKQTIKVNLTIQGSLPACINIFAKNTSSSIGYFNLTNTTGTIIIQNLTQNTYVGMWTWVLLNNCNATAIGRFRQFNFTLTGWW